jgi:biotin operon repressor
MRELELSGAHSAEYLAANLHLSRDLVDGALEVLADSGEITARGDRWAVRA